MKRLFVPLLNIAILTLVLLVSMGLIFTLSHRKPKDVMERYELAKVKLAEEVKSEGPVAALDDFRTIVDDDKELSGLCHGLAHEIGHSAYDAYGMDALQNNDDICGSGYLHGIIEKHFGDITDITSAMKTTCKENDGRCFHALGHGLMYALENDVPESLSYCKTLRTSSEQNQCAEGIFMENFATDEDVHHSDYLREDDPFFPCRGQTPAFMGVCAFYAPRYFLSLHPGAYDDAFAWCGTIDREPRPACVKGIGSAVMKLHIDDPSFAFNLCSKQEGSAMTACTEGATSYLVVHYASPTVAEAFCKALPQAQKSTCQSIAEESRTFYPAE